VANEIEGRQSTTADAKTLVAPVTPPGNTLAEQLTWVANQLGIGVTYDIMLNNDENLGPTAITTRGKNTTIIIRSENPKKPRTVQLKGQGYLFTIDANITLVLRDVVLKGHSENTKPVVYVSPATKLILDSGAKITGNTIKHCGGSGVRVDGSVLELNDGAEIRGNSAGGIVVSDKGYVTIRGGLISENRSDGCGGGGIDIEGGSTVNMSGGIISKNRGTYGGGILINGGIFTKRPAPGSETSGIIYGNIGENANVGHASAINFYYPRSRKRTVTLGDYDEISTESEEGWGK
jgi:hypothetical protein